MARTALVCLLLLLTATVSAAPQPAVGAAPPPSIRTGGAACAMAKWQGTTLDFALATGEADPAAAQVAAERELTGKGYHRYPPHHISIIHHQAVTDLPSAFVVVIRSDHRNSRGRQRTSFGCGFSGRSYREAEWSAIRDLQNHSWGWKPDRDGYEVVRQLKY